VNTKSSPRPFQGQRVRLWFSKPKKNKILPSPPTGERVGGEGDSHPEKTPRGPSKTQRTGLGLESPSYEENQPPTPDRTPNTVRRYSLRGFAASRETKQSAGLCGRSWPGSTIPLPPVPSPLPGARGAIVVFQITERHKILPSPPTGERGRG